jgi:leucyl/phenylalanyl-tRNA--protein transferase
MLRPDAAGPRRGRFERRDALRAETTSRLSLKRALRRVDELVLGSRGRGLYRRHLKFAWSRRPRLGESFRFPDPRTADARGLLALGGDLDPERVGLPYRQGIFPSYYEGEPIQWWCPEPRAILVPARIHVSRRLAASLRKGDFSITFDQAFSRIIQACRELRLENTWIHEEIVRSHTALHARGDVHSVEVWRGEELAGGLYGVSAGGCFALESMCSMADNASKVALVALAQALEAHGFLMIDCQFPKERFTRMGAESVSRSQYLDLLDQALRLESAGGVWAAFRERRLSSADLVRR